MTTDANSAISLESSDVQLPRTVLNYIWLAPKPGTAYGHL
jgi:hypothetical protein